MKTIYDWINDTMKPLQKTLATLGIVGERKPYTASFYIPTIENPQVRLTVHFERNNNYGNMYDYNKPFVDVINQKPDGVTPFAETFKEKNIMDATAIATFIKSILKEHELEIKEK